MNLEDFNNLSREQQREVFRTLPAEQQRAVMADMNRQIEARMKASLDEVFHRDELEDQLVPRIPFKAVPTTPPPEIPLREGSSQEEFVRKVFRSDVGIREIRTADGSIYQGK